MRGREIPLLPCGRLWKNPVSRALPEEKAGWYGWVEERFHCGTSLWLHSFIPHACIPTQNHSTLPLSRCEVPRVFGDCSDD